MSQGRGLARPPGTGEDGTHQRLKADPTTAAIPVLVCSADHALVDRVHDRLTAWACGALRKPFDVADLLTVLPEYLPRRPSVGGREGATGERMSGARPA